MDAVIFLLGKHRSELTWKAVRGRARTGQSTALSLPMQRDPLSAVLPGTFGGGESDQAPTSIQSTQDSSVPANYSSHLIREREGGRTDESGVNRKRDERKTEKEECLETSGTCAFLQEQWITCSHHLSCVVPSVAFSVADRMTVFVQYQASWVGTAYKALHWELITDWTAIGATLGGIYSVIFRILTDESHLFILRATNNYSNETFLSSNHNLFFHI